MRKALVLISLVALATLSFTQTPTGTFQGAVKDQQGAAIVGAEITITNAATGIVRTTATSSQGEYVLPYMLPGTYKVTAAAKGFRPAEQDDVVLEVAQTRSLDFALKVGASGDVVEVVATTPVLDTQTSSLSQVIGTRTVSDLPLNGRNPFDLALLAPTVSNIGNSTIPHIGGARNSVSEEQIDGQTNILPENNVGDNYTAYNPIVDSVQEFSVQTNSLSAEYGRFGGGTISLVTKSGGKKFHGSGFLFARNGVLDAIGFGNPSNTPKPFHRYQSGGTIGGPIVKKNTFFFFAYEDSHEANQAGEHDLVPLPAWYSGATAGDFSALIPAGNDCNANPVAGCVYDPLTVNPNTHKRQAFPGNIIPQNRLSLVAQKMLAFYPTPNDLADTSNGFNYTVNGATTNKYGHWDSRVDHEFGSKWHSFFRLSHLDGHSTPLSDYNNQASQGYDGPQHYGSWSASFNNTFNLSNTLLGEIRVGVTRATVKRVGAGGAFDPTTLGFPDYVSKTAGPQGQIFPRLNMGNGYAGLGPNGYNAFSQNPLAGDVTGSLLKVVGAHSIKVGAEYRKLFENFYQFGLPSGQYNVDQSWTQLIANDTAGSNSTGNPFASFLLGLPTGGNTTHDPSVASSSSYYAFYVQDDWRVTNRLNLNLGLRYDFELPRTERYNKLSFWDPNQASPLQGQVVVPAGVSCPACANLKGAMIFTGTPADKYGRRQGPTQLKDFAPRLGFAYDAGHSLVFRGGFGLVYAPSALQAGGSSGGTGNAGFANQTNFNSTFDNQLTISTTIDSPYPTGYNLPTGSSLGASTFLGSSIGDTYFASYRNPYSVQWNFNIQYALPDQITAEVGYLGNHGLFLVNGDPGDPHDQLPTSVWALGQTALEQQVPNPFYGLITTPGSDLANQTVQARQLLRPYPQYDQVYAFRKPTSQSKYNAFTLRLSKHFSKGLSFVFSFTGGKETDNSAAAVTFLGPTSSTYANQYNPRGEWSVGAQDVSRIFAFGYTYELPFGRGKTFLNSSGALNRLVGGWQMTGIVKYTTGTPVVLSSVGDQTDLYTLGQRPAWTGASAKLSKPTKAEWFNTSVFSVPATWTNGNPPQIGNAPRTIPNVRVPGVSNSDLSFFKNNYFGSEDKYNLQFRLEMFNAFNHPQLNGPDANVNNGTFGKITGFANSARQIQLALKFNF
jgi:Carboxypeptidase regulatory-like domain/TonB dependent receptor